MLLPGFIENSIFVKFSSSLFTMCFIRVQVVQPQFKINPIFLIRDQISIWLLTCQYIDCMYHYCQVRTSDILKLYLVASYFCVDSGESLLRWLWSEYTPSKEEYVSQFAVLLFTSCLLIDNLVMLLSYLGWYKSVVFSFFFWISYFVLQTCSQDLLKIAYLSSPHLAVSPCVSLESRWCIHIVVLTQPQ